VILVDGAATPLVPADDRGLAYGDGVFETMSAVDGRVPLLERHLRRMAEGAGRLGIAMPDAALWRADLARALPAQGRAVAKLVLTRGSGARGYLPTVDAAPRRIVAVDRWADRPASWWSDGIALRVCATRVGVNPALAGLKHLNRLEQVLARAEWSDASAVEGLMLDMEDRVVGGTMSNVFAVVEGALCTPPVDRAGVAGIARALIIEALGARERALTLADLSAAGELFVTNALIGAWPVATLEARRFDARAAVRAAQTAVRAAGLP
jgi:4-amino-4-deoxychorismate lyase